LPTELTESATLREDSDDSISVQIGFWAGLNSFCYHKWTWPCGDLDDVNQGWLNVDIYDQLNSSLSFSETDVCGEIKLVDKDSSAIEDYKPCHEPQNNYKLVKNAADCTQQRYFICERFSKCSKNDRFFCNESK